MNIDYTISCDIAMASEANIRTMSSKIDSF